MTDYDIDFQSVPLGGTAVANIETTDAGVQSDVNSLTAEWRDQGGTLVETLTRTSSDVTGTDIYGNPSSISDPAGTGNYKATLRIDATNYSPPAGGLTWTLKITIVKGTITFSRTFYFLVTQTTLSISLDSAAIAGSVMRQTGIWKDVQIVGQSNSNTLLDFRAGPVYAIVAAYKNGVQIVNGVGYTWTTYQSNATLATAPAVNDHYLFTVQTRSNDFVNDLVVRFTREVIRSLRLHYSDSNLANSPDVVELIKSLSIGQIRQDTTVGTAMDSAVYRAGRDLQIEARAQIRRIQRGEEGIHDSQGAPLVRTDGSIVGGRLHPDGNFVNRLGLQDRVQQHTGLFLTMTPDPIIAQTRATRGFTSTGA